MEFRKQAIATRNAVQNRNQKSANIQARLQAHAPFQAAARVLIYVSIRSEVNTIPLINQLLADPKKEIQIPYCDGDQLKLFQLENWEQLERKSFGLLEPKESELANPDRKQSWPIDIVIVPGLAFDPMLNRMGYGKAYYDRLLAQTIPRSHRIALAFHEQIVDEVPVAAHDIPMHEIVTDQGIFAPDE